MSDYPSTSPFGPHGPQVPANSVTPNPTTPTPPSPAGPTPYGQPDYGASYPRAGSGVAAPPKPKSMVLAVILSLCLGPFGLLYAVSGTSMIQFFAMMLFTGGSVMSLLWFRHATWSPFVIISVIWSVLAVQSYNRRFP